MKKLQNQQQQQLIMDYDKMYFPKSEMSQLVPTGSFSPDTYAAYAESFDLSLLPTDSENLNSTDFCQSNEFDFIPTTILNNDHSQLQQQDQQLMLMTIKSEKPWSNEEIQQATNFTADSSLLLQQLQKQYQFYPSPLPSPPQYEFNNGSSNGSSSSSISSISSNNSLSPTSISSQLAPSPSPSIADNTKNCINFPIKQEYLILPPSPPESNGAPSPFNEIKGEPDIETENLIDINSLLEKSLVDFGNLKSGLAIDKKSSSLSNSSLNSSSAGVAHQDHQVLREYLQDTTFQKKHNLKPLALESLIGGFGVRGDIEPVISLALEHAKRDAQATCASLQISPDPQQWSTSQVHSWIRSTIEQFKLSTIDALEEIFTENGANLLCLTEEEFIKRLPESGGIIHAQLEIWKLACCENFLNDSLMPVISGPSTSNWNSTECSQNMDISDDEDDELPSPTTIDRLTASTSVTAVANGNSSPVTTTSTVSIVGSSSVTNAPTTSTTTSTATATTTTSTSKAPRTGGSHIHLWQFLKELLATPQLHGTAIRWLDRNKGVFKIEDSVRVAKLWGRRKNRPAMNYDKLSRSIRQYYKKGIMKKTERSQRLVYQFCHPYCL